MKKIIVLILLMSGIESMACVDFTNTYTCHIIDSESDDYDESDFFEWKIEVEEIELQDYTSHRFKFLFTDGKPYYDFIMDGLIHWGDKAKGHNHRYRGVCDERSVSFNSALYVSDNIQMDFKLSEDKKDMKVHFRNVLGDGWVIEEKHYSCRVD